MSRYLIILIIIFSTPHYSIAGSFEIDSEFEIQSKAASDRRLKSDTIGAANFDLKYTVGDAAVIAKIEANTASAANSVTIKIDEGDSNSVLGNGKFIVAELKFEKNYSKRFSTTIGLLDSEGKLAKSWDIGEDSIDISTIAFPGFTPGISVTYKISESGPRLYGLVTSSHGLDDNPGKSYRELFDVSEKNKGVFSGLSLRWDNQHRFFDVGYWHNSATQQPLYATVSQPDRYGSYLVYGHKFGNHYVDLRYGWANARVSEEAQFIGLSYAHKLKKWNFKIDYSYTRLSKYVIDPEKDDSQNILMQLERKMSDRFLIGLSIQNLINNDFDTRATIFDNNLLVYGMKFKLTF